MFYKFSMALVLSIGSVEFFFDNFLWVYILICEIDCILLGLSFKTTKIDCLKTK